MPYGSYQFSGKTSGILTTPGTVFVLERRNKTHLKASLLLCGFYSLSIRNFGEIQPIVLRQ